MMSGLPLETYWAFSKLWNNKFYYKAASCWYLYWISWGVWQMKCFGAIFLFMVFNVFVFNWSLFISFVCLPSHCFWDQINLVVSDCATAEVPLWGGRWCSATAKLTFSSLPVTWCTNSLTFNNCTLCPHCIYVLCIYVRAKSNLCHLQHKLIGFYNRDEKCLQRGTDWVFK